MSASAPGSIHLMECSGQTDAERRRLRQQQRDLQKRIQSNAEGMENPSLNVFSKIREENNTLFAKVAYTREAVLDGESLQMISEHAAKHGRDDVNVPPYNAIRLSQKLAQKFKRLDKFDWHSFGVQAGICFNATPSRVQFLKGPLRTDYIPRKARGKRKRGEYVDDEPEERPDIVTNPQENADTSHSGVENHVRLLKQVLKQRSEQVMQQDEKLPDKKKLKQGHYEVNAIQYMFDPHSFTQTVENIFHFSFLIKNGNAKICARPDGPKVASISRSIEKEPRQAIVVITPRDWRDLCRANKVVQSDIPHRTVSEQVHPAQTLPTVDLDTTRTASVETNHEECVEASNPSSNLEISSFRNAEYAETNRDESVATSDPSSNLEKSDFWNEEHSETNVYLNYVSHQVAPSGGDAADSNAYPMLTRGRGENPDFFDVCTPTGSPTKLAPTGSPVVVTPESTQQPATRSPTSSLSEICVNTTIDFNSMAAGDSPCTGGEFVEGNPYSPSGGSCGNRDDSLETNYEEPPDNSNLEASQSGETNNGESVTTSNEESSDSEKNDQHTIINAEERPKVSPRVYLAFWTSLWVLAMLLVRRAFGSRL